MFILANIIKKMILQNWVNYFKRKNGQLSPFLIVIIKRRRTLTIKCVNTIFFYPVLNFRPAKAIPIVNLDVSYRFFVCLPIYSTFFKSELTTQLIKRLYYFFNVFDE